MADFREVQHGYDILWQFFHNEQKRETFKAALDACAPGAADESIKLFDQWWQTIRFNTFIASLSEHLNSEDTQGRLSMWRAYGALTSEQAAEWTLKAQAEQGFGNHGAKLAEWKSVKIRQSTREQDIEEKFQRPFLTTRIVHREIEFYILPSPTRRSRIGLTLADKLAIYRNVLLFGDNERR
jgi:hypothetical protein